MNEGTMEELLTAEETGRILRLAPQTLARRRCEGAPPTFVRIGRRCLYLRSDVMAMVLAQRRTSTADPGPGTPSELYAEKPSARQRGDAS